MVNDYPSSQKFQNSLQEQEDILFKDTSDDSLLFPDLTKDYIALVEEACEAGDIKLAHNLTLSLHPADIADLLEFLERDTRAFLVHAIGDDLTGEMLTELEPAVRDHILTMLEPVVVARLVCDVETGDAVYLLENLPPVKLQEILSHISGLHRIAVEQAFKYPENCVARIMRRDFLSLPGYWTVGQTVDFCMESKDLPEKFYEIYVVDPAYKPIGAIAIPDLLKAGRSPKLEDLANPDFNPVSIEDTTEDVAYQFEHYRLNSVPVIGHGGRIIGVILMDDVVEIIQEGVEDDIKQLAGVGGEELTDSVAEIVKNRGYWLAINLITAILASIIISFFGETIEKYVVLAAMGPLVASMGGNSGSQTLTVAVRAIATRMLTETNMKRIIFKELKIGLINGFLFASIVAILVVIGALFDLWALDYKLCLIMGVAMLVQMIAAALSGILIPLILRAFKIDPAVSAVVFVTTVTDVVGFFSVLGLATWILD